MNKCNKEVRSAIQSSGFLGSYGLWAVVDGQYGSTGKGLACSVLADVLGPQVDVVTSNAGPNSGHTSYDPNGEKVVLQQLPTFAVMSGLFNDVVPDIYMNAGAIIDKQRLLDEMNAYVSAASVSVNPAAAIVTDAAKNLESELVGRIGSTGKGTGGALARKVLRAPDAVVAQHDVWPIEVERVDLMDVIHRRGKVFMEVSQGYSLSLNASGMYPYTTSRDCTLMQGMSDAGIHPTAFRGAMMVVRTFPIRVAGNSGPGYEDQDETSWEALGQTPEVTTVTLKTRRVFTFSWIQFREALRANRPCSLMVNFIQYLPVEARGPFLRQIVAEYTDTLGHGPRLVLVGHGPLNSDVEVYNV